MTATGRIGWTGAATAALGVNAVVLTLLALEDRRPLAQRPTPNRPVLYVELEPVPSPPRPRSSTRRLEPAASDDGPVLTHPIGAHPASPAAAVGRATETGAAPTPASPPSAMGLSRDWLARRDNMLANGGDPTRRAAGQGPRNCAWAETLSATESERCRDFAQARVDPRAPPPTRSGDEAREDGFAHEAAAKRRWRDYRNGEGEYPGLRSMLGKNR